MAYVTLAVPFAMLAGQVRGQAFAAMSLGQLVVRASRDPMTPAAIARMIGDALGDPSLRIAVWDAEADTYVDVDGTPIEAPPDGGTQAITHVVRGGLPVAVLLHDPSLHTDTDFAEDLAATALMLLENWNPVQELRVSRSRLVRAAERERRRLEMDPHDGAQQSLMAIQLRTKIAQEAPTPADVAFQLRAIERESETALQELRELAHGIYPAILNDLGLVPASQAVARRSSIPIEVSSNGVRRYPDTIEAAVYFCAREAIQNAAKHAGPGARVTITLTGLRDAIGLTVSDDGAGMAFEAPQQGTGDPRHARPHRGDRRVVRDRVQAG